jgi:hypothetical protein
MRGCFVCVVVVLGACGRGAEHESRQPAELSSPAPAGGDTPFSAARGGRAWFCRTIVTFDNETHEVRRLGFCRADLAQCNELGGGPSQLFTQGSSTRIVGPCEEYPIAYCYATSTDREDMKVNRDYYRKVARDILLPGLTEPLEHCFTDVVACRENRGKDAATDCFPAGNPFSK